MKTAAAYIRVSTDDQIEYSPESQIKAIRDYAKRSDYILPDEYIYIDEGISGKTAGKRPAFMNMIGMAKAKPKPFDAILLWKFSRFARNREDSIVYKSMLRKQLGIEVISISESIGDDKMSVLIEAMIEAMDEYYSINLAEEVKRGMTEKARRGEPLSIPPFGYKMENKQLIPINEESNIIKQVFNWYDNGVGMLKIAKNLNAAGIRTHRGGLIENRTVEYWLNNPVYAGKIRWTPTGAANRNYHNSDSIIADGNHKPLIDTDTWDRVQKRMKEQKERYRKWHKPSNEISHWLVGIVHCGKCGGSIVNCNGYLYCNNRAKGTCVSSRGIKTASVEAYVIRQLEGFLNDSISINVHEHKNPNTCTDIYDTQLKRAQARMKRVREAYENGIDTLEEYRCNKQNIQHEIDSILAEIKKTHLKEINSETNIQKLQNTIRKSIDELKAASFSAKEKNILAREFIADIIRTGSDGCEFNIIYRL